MTQGARIDTRLAQEEEEMAEQKVALSGEGTTYRLADSRLRLLLSGEQTGGQFCMFDVTKPARGGTPPHVHATDDETMFVIEGELTAVVDGEDLRVSAGQSILLPHGTPHALKNAGDVPVRYLLLGTPAAFDRFVLEAGTPVDADTVEGPPTPEEIRRMVETGPKHGITMLG